MVDTVGLRSSIAAIRDSWWFSFPIYSINLIGSHLSVYLIYVYTGRLHRMMNRMMFHLKRSSSMIQRYVPCCRCTGDQASATATSLNNHHHHHPPHHSRPLPPYAPHTTWMERMVDKMSDLLEMFVYWIGPLLILLALSIVILLCYTFIFILLPMIYQKHSIPAMTVTQLQHESYTIPQLQSYIFMTFHCTIVIVLVTNVLYNYACCVLQSHAGTHYDTVVQELAAITNTTIPKSPSELLSYRKQLSNLLTTRMKEQQQPSRTAATRASVDESSNHHHHHNGHSNELTQRRTTANNTGDDSLLSSMAMDVAMLSHSSGTIPTTTTTQPPPVSMTTVPTTTAHSQPPSTTTATTTGTVTKKMSPSQAAAPKTTIRAWMLLGPYEWGYCSHSQQAKPPRSHYDHVTKLLILNLDHYCPWMFNAGNVMLLCCFVMAVARVYMKL